MAYEKDNNWPYIGNTPGRIGTKGLYVWFYKDGIKANDFHIVILCYTRINMSSVSYLCSFPRKVVRDVFVAFIVEWQPPIFLGTFDWFSCEGLLHKLSLKPVAWDMKRHLWVVIKVVSTCIHQCVQMFWVKKVLTKGSFTDIVFFGWAVLVRPIPHQTVNYHTCPVSCTRRLRACPVSTKSRNKKKKILTVG